MRILLIVEPERFDFYSYLALAEDVEWVLLWYEKPEQQKIPSQSLPINFSRVCYWNEFTTPMQLLDEIKPDRIVLFEIIDLRQIALNVTARAYKVPTIYLEHGAAGDKDTAIGRWKEITFSNQKLPYLINRFRKALPDVVRSKFFYFSVVKGFQSIDSYKKYVSLPFKLMKDSPNKVLSFNKFKERIPLKSIVFNQANYEEHFLYTGRLPEDALFTGVPFFDKFYRGTNLIKDYIVFIDHPYLEENLCGWTEEHHRNIANSLFAFAEQRKISLFIKLHPRSNPAIWQQYSFNKDYVTIVQHGEFTDLYLESKLILGFSSSLINAFLCARKNVVLLGWHSNPMIFGADFSKSGLCYLSVSPDDLKEKYDYWVENNLAIKNEALYNAFLHRFNYPFDGKASERVIEAIKYS